MQSRRFLVGFDSFPVTNRKLLGSICSNSLRRVRHKRIWNADTKHSIQKFFLPASKEQIEQIYIRALNKKAITEDEGAMYRGYLLTRLGEFYAKRNLVM